MSFNYKLIKRPDDVGDIKGPNIPVVVFGENGTYEVIFLVDSGADTTVLSRFS